MLIRWEDRDWALDVSDLTNRQAEALETGMRMSISEFYDLLEGEDGEGFDAAKPHFVKLMTILYWLMLDKNGVKVKITDVEFPLIAFAQAFVAAMDAAAQPAPVNGQVKPDPTRRPGDSPPSRAPSSRSKKTRAVTAGSPDG